MGCCGNTSSTSKAALSTMRRAPQLGQKPLRSPKATTVGATERDQMPCMTELALYAKQTVFETVAS